MIVDGLHYVYGFYYWKFHFRFYVFVDVIFSKL